MQIYDILMLLVLAGTTLFGFCKGMAWQVASLASLVLSAVVAFRLGPEVAARFQWEEPWRLYLAMLILYLVTSLAIWLAFRLVAGVIDRVRLREFDRQIGAMFGLAKGVLLCVIITFFVVTLSESARQIVLGTHSGRFIAVLIRRATPVLPEEVTGTVGKYLDELDRKLDPTTPPDEDSLLDGLQKAPTDLQTPRLGEAALEDLKGGIDRAGQEAGKQLDRAVNKAVKGIDKRLDDLNR